MLKYWKNKLHSSTLSSSSTSHLLLSPCLITSPSICAQMQYNDQQLNIQLQFAKLQNHAELIVEPGYIWLPISKNKFTIFEDFLINFFEGIFDENIPAPSIFPTIDGNITAEWFPDKKILLKNKTQAEELDSRLFWSITIETGGLDEIGLTTESLVQGGFTLFALNHKTNDCLFECYYFDGNYAYTINDDDSIFVENGEKVNLTDKLKSFW